MRTTNILGAILVGTLLFACEDPNAKQKEADKAREQARQESDKAQQEAQRTQLEQQAKADEKQREATAALEKARGEYRTRLNDTMSDIDKRISDLQAKNVTASAKDKAANVDTIAQLNTKRQVLVDDLKEVDRTTSAGWDDLKKRIDADIADARKLIPFIAKT